ncbi:hypothetical protein FNV43_RR13622 [Rhamnella rubrinervis]|uniref:J domain-containing protein n=1 Tax=Rhamnella rubrinervis TaxID=2594499 RepID=A0A8K0MFG4_9ROSA|nr:hypothetical protein FNV43_RR13622 [Rhamnella rubrinervis]
MGHSSKKKKQLKDTSDDSSPSDGSSDDSGRSSKSRRRHRHRSDRSSRREKEKRERDGKRSRRRERRDKESKRRRLRKEDRKKRRDYGSGSSDESESGSSRGSDSDPERSQVQPQALVQDLLNKFPNVGNDLKQLLQMIDSGQAVDIKGISERSLIKHLEKLFLSLSIRENGDKVFLLPKNVRPTLDVLGPLLNSSVEVKDEQQDPSVPPNDTHPDLDIERRQLIDDNNVDCPKDDAPGPTTRRMIGPAMPSAELLAAAAKLTEAQAELREAELGEDTGIFIGPPPPAMVAEAESANEAERFEEVTRIMDAEGDSPYDILGVNHSMTADNVKKRYWKMSLLVHPDKCSHPQAHQAFIKLNKAFKEIQDPDKRKAIDEKIKVEEERQRFKVELKAMREAAQWRRSQGISMEGDDELLAETDVKEEPKRDEWMTTLPPERKPGGMPMHSTQFSRNPKEGRGDTSVWTDTPSDRAQKAKINYLEAYNEAASLASNEVQKSSDADLVDKYNKEKRSKSLVEKHQEKAAKRSKKKSSQPKEKEDWVGQHPWKPWDREKDLTAGRQSVKLDSENMSQGLTSRFSSASFQRNFL